MEGVLVMEQEVVNDDDMLFECPFCKDFNTTFQLTGPFVLAMNSWGDPELDYDVDIMEDYYLDRTMCFCESCEHTALLREFIKKAEP